MPRRFLISAGASAALMLTIGVSVMAWGPKSGAPAVVGPASKSAVSQAAMTNGGKVVTGGSIQKPPNVTLPGNRMPAFSLAGVKATNSGAVVTSGGYPSPEVISFMASWCTECQLADRTAESVFRAYGGQVRFVGIDVGDSADQASRFLNTEGVTFPVGLDQSQKLAQADGVYGLPETFFVEKGGKVEHQSYGPMTAQQFIGQVRQLISKSA